MNMLRFCLFLMIFILIVPIIFAEKQMTLLAIEEGVAEKGSIATLNLKVVDGKGDVFVATHPLTKLDTQISARFAKDIACDYLKIDCSKKDFLYTINANSGIIGGPSAGSAFAVITIAELQDLNLDSTIAISGTINSGGLIGPVGGLKAKIKSAVDNHINIVLIPSGTRFQNDESDARKLIADIFDDQNISKEIKTKQIDLVEYGKSLEVDVYEVSDVEEALSYFEGYRYVKKKVSIEIDENYLETMEEVSNLLCDYTNQIMVELGNKSYVGNIFYDAATQLINKSKSVLQNKEYYTRASYCFGANVQLRSLQYEKLSNVEFLQATKEISAVKLGGQKDASIRNLQTALIVNERMDEKNILVKDALKLFNSSLQNGTNGLNARHTLAFAKERLNSAVAWSIFFEDDVEDGISKQDLKLACEKKLDEAKERIEYVTAIYDKDFEIDFESARKKALQEKYDECLFKASLAKSEANVLLSVMGVSNDRIDTIIYNKLEAAKREIVSQESFPILAYSYYEYGNNLIDDDPGAALTYAEYALELSNLDIYFEGLKYKEYKNVLNWGEAITNPLVVLLVGLLLGLLIGRWMLRE